MTKQVLFIADSLDNAHKFQQVLSTLEVRVAVGSSAQFKSLLVQNPAADLVVFEAGKDLQERLAFVESILVDQGVSSLLVVVDEHELKYYEAPVQVKSDFVAQKASPEECSLRIRHLLWPEKKSTTTDYLTIDSMTINLATYQVKVGEEPLDFTYLEYALLAFLATHPGRTYSRDTLLRRVWGFDYYGGSRTVDVHVRRVRAKLGPDLAEHLETVRGVGYLWTA